jgi:translation initiation factor 3 subunit I
LNKNVFASHEDGSVAIYNDQTGELIQKIKAHEKEITCLKLSVDMNSFVTSSKDNTWKVCL